MQTILLVTFAEFHHAEGFLYSHTDLKIHRSYGSSQLLCEHGLAERFLSQITGTCYNLTLANGGGWGMCDDEERFTCRRLVDHITIAPSCSYCDRLSGTARVHCYNLQLKAAECAIHNMVIPTIAKTFSCVRDKGHCVLYRSVSGQTTPTTESPDPCTTTVRSEQGSTEHLRWKCKKCEPCEECQTLSQSRGMSVGGAVGLFLLGLVIGAVLTCALCLFVPNCHSKSSSILHGKVLKRHKSPPSDNESQGTASRQVAGISNVQYGDHRRDGPSSADTYNDLARRSAAGSHTYTGLQSPSAESAVYSDPASSDTYNVPHDRVSRTSSVSSPTYQVPEDDVISGTTNHNRERFNRRPRVSNQVSDDGYDHTNRPMRNIDTNPTGNTYNTLQNTDTNNSTTRGQTPNGVSTEPESADHQYFVLQPEDNDMAPLPETHHQSPNRDSTYSPSHSYFILERR